MARLRRFVAAGINVSLPEPHSRDRYAELLRAIFLLKKPVRVRGDQHIVISAISFETATYVEGTLARFTEIDRNLPWFNLESLDQAEDSDRLSIIIPDRLHPNYKPFLFHFDIANHVFVFERAAGQQSLSALAVMRFLTESTSHVEITNIFGTVSISLIQSDDALDVIFGLPYIRRLRILYRLPNPDDQSSLEQVMQRRLRAVNGSQIDTIWESDARAPINPNDPEVRALAVSALRNGVVETSGLDSERQPVTKSSECHPKLASEHFDPGATSETNVLRHLTRFFFR